jgi:hypothetical protein
VKVRITVDVSEHDRLVIAKFFAAAASTPRDKARTRATRAQVKQFLKSALRTSVKDYATDLRGRSRAAAARLKLGSVTFDAPLLPEPREKQQRLL